MNNKETFMYCFVYMTSNLVNNRSYVGWHLTNNIDDGYVGSGKILRKAISKYGKENFKTSILENIKIEEWKEKEIYWINEKKTHVSLGGYNLTLGGEGSLGRIASPETCEKLRLANLGDKPWRYKFGIRNGKDNGMYGKNHTSESIDKMKEKHKGKKLTNEHKTNIGLSLSGDKNPMFGIHFEILTCPHCGKSIEKRNFVRWHGNKCKFYSSSSSSLSESKTS